MKGSNDNCFDMGPPGKVKYLIDFIYLVHSVIFLQEHGSASGQSNPPAATGNLEVQNAPQILVHCCSMIEKNQQLTWVLTLRHNTTRIF